MLLEMDHFSRCNQDSDWRGAYACRRRVGCPVRYRESVGESATQCLGSAYRTRPKIGGKWNGFVRVDVGQRRTQAAREKPMKKLLMIAAAASLLVTAATAQTTVTTGVGSAAVQKEGNAHSDAYGADAPSQDTASSDYQVETSVATSDVGTLEHPAMWARLRSRPSALRTLPYDRSGEVCTMLSLSSPRRGQ